MAFKETFFFLNLLLIGCILGIVFIFQSTALGLCKLFVRIIFFLVPADRKLKPIILKNLDSHSLKILNANLLYSLTICFLIYQSTNFNAINVYINQGIVSIFGGDLSLYGVDKFSCPKFEEKKLIPILDNLIALDFVESYSINSSPIYR